MGTNKIGREKYIEEILIDNIIRQDIYGESKIDDKLNEYYQLKKKIEYGDGIKSKYNEEITLLEERIDKALEDLKKNNNNTLSIRYNKIQKDLDDLEKYNPLSKSVKIDNRVIYEGLEERDKDIMVKKFKKDLEEIETEYKNGLDETAFIKILEKKKSGLEYTERDYINYITLRTFFKSIDIIDDNKKCNTDIFKCFYDNYIQAKSIIEKERTKYNVIISEYIKLVDKSPYDRDDERFIKYLNYIKLKILENKDIYIEDKVNKANNTNGIINSSNIVNKDNQIDKVNNNELDNNIGNNNEVDNNRNSIGNSSGNTIGNSIGNSDSTIVASPFSSDDTPNIKTQIPINGNNFGFNGIDTGNGTLNGISSQNMNDNENDNEKSIIMPPPFPLFINNEMKKQNNIKNEKSIIMPPPFPLFINGGKKTKKLLVGGACNILQNITEENGEKVKRLEYVKETIEDIIYQLDTNYETIEKIGENCETINNIIKLYNTIDLNKEGDIKENITYITDIYNKLSKYSKGSENISKLKIDFNDIYDNIKSKILRNKDLKTYIKEKTNKNIDDTISDIKSQITIKLNDLNKVYIQINPTNLTNLQDISQKLNENKTISSELIQLTKSLKEYEDIPERKAEIVSRMSVIKRDMEEKREKIANNIKSITSKKNNIQLSQQDNIEKLKDFNDINASKEKIKGGLVEIKKNITYKSSSSIERAIISNNGNEQQPIYNRLWDKYMMDINDPNKLIEESQDKLYKSYKINNLDPSDALKITMDDKFIFVFIIFIIRQISLAIVGYLIDIGLINSLYVSLIAYTVFYIAIILIIILVINLDDYKLRTILNYFNLHINSTGIISHLVLVTIFIGVLYFLAYSMSPSLGDNVSKNNKLNDIEIMRLTFRLELITITVFVFTSIIDLLLL